MKDIRQIELPELRECDGPAHTMGMPALSSTMSRPVKNDVSQSWDEWETFSGARRNRDE
jgi:hypothetical protein